ncbi:MAG: beta-galactosidase [Prevotella sp.]
MKTIFTATLLSTMSLLPVTAQIPTSSITWDEKSLIFDGKRVAPVMGEIHYSRLPEAEWSEEIAKMKDGGVTIIATYVFWNHIEEREGIFDWHGRRNLRLFLEKCKEADIPVVLRLGPFCHGEVRNGGIPDWMFDKGCKLRDENKTFLHYATLLYRQIFTQVQGLQWKDGGPVVAVQFDNEYRGKGSYLMALKKIANSVGFDLPFYTRTGWPELRSPVPFGEMLPLYGDYADGFWDRSIQPTAGNYYKAFNFKSFRSSTAIATEQLGEQKAELGKEENRYPYFTCELGGGMATAYHRRPFIYPEDSYSMATVKLGSGSNLLGYYMYHGGTNPDGYLHTLNENQRTRGTNYNDMPVKNYDFQAPIGEFGQLYPHYFMLRKLHLFMQDYGETLADMESSFPAPQDIKKGDNTHLRWAYRSKGNSAFVFVNNYERLQQLTDKKDIQFDVCGTIFPTKPITIPAGTICIFPVNIDGIRYATAQIIASRDGRIYLQQIKGIPTEIALTNGKTLRNLTPKGTKKPVYSNIYLLNEHDAERLFYTGKETLNQEVAELTCQKMREAKAKRTISIGCQNVAEAPADSDFIHAAVYDITLPDTVQLHPKSMVCIDYQGDCARLYAGEHLVADNFYNGRPMLFGLWRLKEMDLKPHKLQLRILPLQKDMPVYGCGDGEGEEVKRVTLVQ